MKKFLESVLIICLILSLSACINKDKAEQISEPETEAIEREMTPETTVETMGPIGLGRVPADDVIVETNAVEETEDIAETKEIEEVPEIETAAAHEATIPNETPDREDETGSVGEMKQETLPSEEISTDDGDDWGGGRV